ncbi:MAG: endonuclease/exonuclease/phosphatase family protein [Niabella sp.]
MNFRYFWGLSKRVLWVTNMIFVALFLLACASRFFNPQSFPLLALMSIAFPFFLLCVIAFLVWWLFVKSRWALLSGIALLIGWSNINNFFAFHFSATFKEEKQKGDIRVATWNVARFVELVRNNNKGSQTRYKMLQQIKRTNADILCFQEFTSSINPDWYNNVIAVTKGLGYPYHFFSHDYNGEHFFTGSVIFSRFPIVDTGMVRFPRPTLSEPLVFADIKKGNKLFRVYTTHLQSNQLLKQDFDRLKALKEGKSIRGNSSRLFAKLSFAIQMRSIQADVVANLMENSPHPTIFCGDMNDVPNSYCYHAVRGDKQDAFLKKGFGIGRTFRKLSPTIRIDYIFADKDFKINQFKRITTDYSDHYMLVTDMSL